MSKADELAVALDEFLAGSAEVEAAAVVSTEGLPMASALPPHVEEDRLAAMSGALLTLGERAASGLGKGELAQVFVEGDQGYVVLMAAGGSAAVVAVTGESAKVGLLLFEMRRTAERVAEIMKWATASPGLEEDHDSTLMQDQAPAEARTSSGMNEPVDSEADSALSSWRS